MNSFTLWAARTDAGLRSGGKSRGMPCRREGCALDIRIPDNCICATVARRRIVNGGVS